MANSLLSLGYLFHPADHVLINYLSCKANGESLPCEGVIEEVDLYSLSDPGKLFQRSEKRSVYVFTKVKNVSPSGKKVDRKVIGNRTSRGVAKGRPIYDQGGRLVGEKKNFNFINKMKMQLGYNMTEFVLDKGTLSAAKFKDYVLYEIKKVVKRGRSVQEEDSSSSRISMEEESNFSSDMDLMPKNSLVSRVIVPSASDLGNIVTKDAIPFLQPAADQYYCQNSPANDPILLPESVEQYFPFSGLITNENITSMTAFDNAIIGSEFDQHCCQNSLVNNAILLPGFPEQCCPFSGFRDGTTTKDITSMTASHKAVIGSESFEDSATRMCDTFPEFAKIQEQEAEDEEDLAILSMIDDVTSSSPSDPLSAHDIIF